jgi:hypothetical protein
MNIFNFSSSSYSRMMGVYKKKRKKKKRKKGYDVVINGADLIPLWAPSTAARIYRGR